MNSLSVTVFFANHLVHFVILFHVDRPDTPLDLTAVNLTSHNFTLTWVEPHDNNAPIEGYVYVKNTSLMCIHIYTSNIILSIMNTGSVCSVLQI